MELHKKQQFAVVTFDENRLDASRAGDFKNYMEDLINKGESKIILDLSNVNFMDSSGLGAVVAVKKKLNSNDENCMYLVGAKDTVKDLLTLTCMDKIFPIFPSIDDALEE